MGKTEDKTGVVMSLERDAIRSAPLAFIEFTNGEKLWVPASKDMYVGQKILAGGKAPLSEGNWVELGRLREGQKVFCLELRPGDGGRVVRTAGNAATVLSREGDNIKVKMPSGKVKVLDARCRAIIGTVAGMGTKEKPILRAGSQFHIKKAKHAYWPRVSASAMNAFEHPFGGGRKHGHASKPQTSSRRAPRGRKVGYIAARRTGKRR